MESLIQTFTAAADPTTWVGRSVYLSANNTVALNNAGTQAAIGIVTKALVNGSTYHASVCLDGVAWGVAGETTLDADAAGVGQYVRGGDDSGGAALDGRMVAATAGDFYVGKMLAGTNITAGGLVRILVKPGQLSVAGS